MTSKDDKPRVWDNYISLSLQQIDDTLQPAPEFTNAEVKLFLLDLRDARAALADANKEVTALTVERGLLRRDARINKFNIAKAERERDDAIAHADDFGAEVDRLRAELDNAVLGQLAFEKCYLEYYDKYNALRDAVQDYNYTTADGDGADEWARVIDLLKDDRGGGEEESSSEPDETTESASS